MFHLSSMGNVFDVGPFDGLVWVSYTMRCVSRCEVDHYYSVSHPISVIVAFESGPSCRYAPFLVLSKTLMVHNSFG